MAVHQNALTNWSQYLALRLATAGLHMFSVDRNLASARAMGAAMYRFDHKHRKRAIYNIRLALPDLSDHDVERIARASMQHFLQLGIEVLFTPRLLQLDTWADRLEVGNIRESLDLVLSDRPVIMATPHFGNWEVLGYAMALLGIDLSAVARPIDNPLVNDYLLGVRQRKGMKIITKWGASEVMTDVLQRGGTLGFIADQNAGDKGMFVPFMGRLASTYKSIGLLAIRYNAPVICGGAHRIGNRFEYEFHIQDIIYPEQWAEQDDPLFYLTARYNRAMEQLILRYPEQYLWIHRRWRSRPRHERLGKPMPKALRRKLETLPWMDQPLMDRLLNPPDEL